MNEPTIITGTVGMDAHVIGTKILSRAFREAGFNVVELGILTPPEEFIQAAVETNADAILMSSLYGMAELDVRGFKEKCIEAGLADVLLYIGGILGFFFYLLDLVGLLGFIDAVRLLFRLFDQFSGLDGLRQLGSFSLNCLIFPDVAHSREKDLHVDRLDRHYFLRSKSSSGSS